MFGKTARVLVFGLGRIADPVLEDLGRQSTVDITAVSPFQGELKHVKEMYPKVKTECVDIIKDTERRDTLIKQHDIVLGLIPDPMMPDVFRACLTLKKHFVSPNYLTEDTKNLHEEVKEADLTFLCELGLDPGIDHMLAAKTCNDIRRKGGRISSYEMWCGGLPAPENAQDNPLQYKFSWYPKGALSACVEGGGLIKDKKVTVFPPGMSLMENVRDVNYSDEFRLEGFSNVYQDLYLKLYNIESVDSFMRGTLRYKGFCAAVLSLMKLGLFDDTPHALLADNSMQHSWKKIICHEMGVHSEIVDEDLEKRILDKLGNQEHLDLCKRLGLLSDDAIEAKETLLDTLTIFLESKPEFTFGKMQRDLVLMRIKVEGKYPDGSQENRHLDLTVYGDPGRHSAMAKTVGHAVASIVMLLVKGELTERGIVLPVSENIYVPVLADLNKKGITVTEKIVPGGGN